MGGSTSRPTIVKHQRRSVSIRSWKGGSLIELLLDGKYTEVTLTKIRAEAHKEVCVKLDDDQERWVLPLHVACALPDAPLSIIRKLAQAYPKALTHHTTMRKKSKLEMEGVPGGANKEFSTLSVTSSVVSTVSSAWGVGWLPLHVAVYYGAPVETVELLLEESPASIYCKTTQGFLPLHVACTAIDSSHHLIETLVKAFPLSLYVLTSDGFTAQVLVEIAAKGGYRECVSLLEPSPISASQSSERLSRPVHNIPCAKRRSILKTMASTGRLENQVNRETKLFRALSKKKWGVALDLLSRKPKEASIWTLSPDPNDPPCHLLPLHMAIRRRAPLKVIKVLLNANPNAIYRREFYGMLPLHVACNLGLDVDIVVLLCEASPMGAHQPDLGGMFPLHLACATTQKRRPEVITYLLSVHSKAMHIPDNQSNLPEAYLAETSIATEMAKEFSRGDAFWGAAKEIQKNTVAFLICQKQWDAALERLQEAPEEASMWTVHPLIHLRYLPLHYACIVKAPADLVRVLLEVSLEAASTECQEYDMLPLHLACQHSATPSVVQSLLAAHKDAASVPDAFDMLPLHLACTQGASDVTIEALVEAYPQAVQAVDRNGHTPIVYAEAVVDPHSKKVIQLLEMS
jgi:ankyrin repeat protein